MKKNKDKDQDKEKNKNKVPNAFLFLLGSALRSIVKPRCQWLVSLHVYEREERRTNNTKLIPLHEFRQGTLRLRTSRPSRLPETHRIREISISASLAHPPPISVRSYSLKYCIFVSLSADTVQVNLTLCFRTQHHDGNS